MAVSGKFRHRHDAARGDREGTRAPYLAPMLQTLDKLDTAIAIFGSGPAAALLNAAYVKLWGLDHQAGSSSNRSTAKSSTACATCAAARTGELPGLEGKQLSAYTTLEPARNLVVSARSAAR